MNRSAWLAALLAWLVVSHSWAQPAVQLSAVNSPQLWQRFEFQIANVPSGFNPFDPDRISLDATITPPSGKAVTVPAFWYQAYQRSQSGGTEVDTATGSPSWRLRYTPTETGNYTVSLTIRTNGQIYGSSATTNFTVPVTALPARYGYVSVAPSKQYFQTGDGQGLPLRGEDCAVNFNSGNQGTYDYDTYFPAMAAAGMNFARVIMAPMTPSLTIEGTPNTLTNYALGPAWEVDYILQLAEQKGIYVQLCLDYHGMFMTTPDQWGDNYWVGNPYSSSNGGPCTAANAFFTNSTAIYLYEKRLRYLVARYGYSQYLLGWEFLNEIDNDYGFLNSTNVTTWHGIVGGWMRTNDVYHHLLTTSLSGATSYLTPASISPWTLPQIDYVSEHSYGRNSPATGLANDAQLFLTYQGITKPVMIGEYGTSNAGWNRTADPYLRGFRQGIWGGALGGSVGTAMSWWWEHIQSDNAYPTYTSVGTILNRTGWGKGGWTKVTTQPLASTIGLSGAHEALVYVVAPGLSFPTGATNSSPPVQHLQTVTLTKWPAGNFIAEWYDPATAAFKVRTQGTTTNGNLVLTMPDFTEDLTAIVYPPPRLTAIGYSGNNGLQLRLDSETGGQYTIQGSTDLTNWSALVSVTNTNASVVMNVTASPGNRWSFFRAKHN